MRFGVGFYGSRSVLWVFKVPGWFFMVENIRLICNLAPRSCLALPAVGRLWPSDDDDGGASHNCRVARYLIPKEVGTVPDQELLEDFTNS